MELKYIAYVELKSAGSNVYYNEIATHTSTDLKDKEYQVLNDFIANYSGETWKVSQALSIQHQSIHRKLLKEAMEDVRYMLTVNAVKSGYSEYTDEDLFENDTPSDEEITDEEYDQVFAKWKEEEERKLQQMSREERTEYLTKRYEIELDFDENDYLYRFCDETKTDVATDWIE